MHRLQSPIRRQPGDPSRYRGLRPMALRPLLSEEFAFITIRDIQLSMSIYSIGFLFLFFTEPGIGPVVIGLEVGLG
jgi:hypothetical protein